MDKVAVCALVLVTFLTQNRAGQIHSRWAHFSLAKIDGPQKSIDDECKDQICDHWPGYPMEEIEMAMKRQGILKRLFNGDPILNTSTNVTLDSRTSVPSGTSKQLCSTEGPHTRKPQRIRNLNNEWKDVVNTPNYQQTITVEICRKYGRQDQIQDHCTIMGHSCMQNRQTLSLLIYEDGIIKFENFNLPITCNCCAANG